MKRHLSAVALACSLILNVSFVGGYAFKRFAGFEKPVEEDIEASPEQRAQMKQMREEFLEGVEEIAQRMSGLHTELVDAIALEPADPGAIESTFAEIRSNQRAMQRLVAGHLLAVKGMLTPEQRIRFFALLKERMQSQTFGPRWLMRQPGNREK
jgi:Spy/CpxP family protein refolding chaperone